ncbi:hypothetical protein PPL_01805 [Heterostelium album PN500]|uniref:Uncharacterized protein n=1 Tax=Heterostelium pallidum (strain ATCC 26659 / Pp 5 / PN500) TaxID=670386 RepID=D3B0I8_HETP5|nr:hypothetical protein PPL_01805 [Heterostelium album PN500]EFA84812.1 hypothetical protein PPL_01805 [Heterostelium album PN500]|eukprot:XP_020436923.1 hypothetical protein PPL_01805 [Heterostelium album PN500]
MTSTISAGSTTSPVAGGGAAATGSNTQQSSRADVVNYVVFKSKGHQNTVFTPMDIHPVNPWVLFADGDNNIVIQNYVTSQKILNFSIGQHEEERRELHLLQRKIPTLSNLSISSPPTPPSASQASPSSPSPMTNLLMSPSLSQAHRSPNNTVRLNTSNSNNNLASSNIGGGGGGSGGSGLSNDHISGVGSGNTVGSSRSTTIGDSSDLLINEKLEKLGQIRFLHFYDRHTRLVKERKSKTSQAKSGVAASSSKVNNSIGSDDYIVVVADNRILFINYHSQRIREVKVPIFDFKPPTSIEFFSNLPLVAFGSSDSVIRLWNVDKWELEKPLTGGHSKNNTTILKMKSIENSDGDYLVTCGSDGYTCLWNLKTSSLQNQFPKVHDIIDLSYDSITGNILVLTSDRDIKDIMWKKRVPIVGYDFTS